MVRRIQQHACFVSHFQGHVGSRLSKADLVPSSASPFRSLFAMNGDSMESQITSFGTHLVSASQAYSVDPGVATAATTTTTQTFEPILNVPALGSFVLIAIIFSFLFFRTRLVEEAIQRRKAATQRLKQAKALEVTGDVSAEEIAECLKEFEDAMQKEEQLRTLIPGIVRIVPPVGGNREAEKEAKQISQRYLGREYDIGRDDAREENKGLSTVSIVVLSLVFLGQIGLLVYLNIAAMDPSMVI